MIVKVKEPLPSERKLLRSGQVLFTFFIWQPISIHSRSPDQRGDVYRLRDCDLAHRHVAVADPDVRGCRSARSASWSPPP